MAPDQSHYARYDHRFMAPSHVTYGSNNRSAAIRVPDASPRRLEHRIASPMTDPYLALFVIIKSIYLGIKDPAQIKQYLKIHGNTFDEQYGAEALPCNIELAMSIFDKTFFEMT
jgi:glutamine synthetase